MRGHYENVTFENSGLGDWAFELRVRVLSCGTTHFQDDYFRSVAVSSRGLDDWQSKLFSIL